MSSFMKKIQEKDKKNKDKLLARLGKEDTLYMGDPSLQWATGGWIRGKANLVYGPSGCGKSTLVLNGAGVEQKKTDGYVLIFDSEYSHHDPNETDPETDKYTDAALGARERYTKCGINPDMVIVRQSNEIDNLFFGLPDLEEDIQKGKINISAIIIDSWGGIQSETAKKKIAKGEMGAAGNQFGGNAKTMGPLLQELLRLSAENGITMFFVQHCINNMDEYGPKYLLLGGQKLRFLVHMTLFMESIAAKDASLLADGTATTKETKGSDIIYKIGKKIRFKCEKSRKVVEGRGGEFWFDFENCKFALPGASLFDLAESLGVIGHPENPELETKGPQKGQPKRDKDGVIITKTNKMYWEFPVKSPSAQQWHGQSGMKAALNEHQDLFNEVFQACLTTTKLGAVKAPEIVEVEE